MFLFQVLGVIILLCYILILKVKSISDSVPILKNCLIEGKMKIVTPILSFIFILLPGLIFYAEYGTNYYLVSPLGNEFAVMDSRGFKLRLFSRISPWTKYIDIKTVDTDSTGIILEDTEELEGYIKGGIPIRFIDQVTGKVMLSARFQTPTEEGDFMDMAKKFRTMSNLVNNTLIPTLIEQTTNTGYMFAAQDYISGEAQLFKQTLEEQLKDGSYQVIKEELKDTIYSSITDTASRGIKEINTSYKVRKVYSGGKPVRIPHEITKNNILVSQVIIQDVDPEPKFKERLEKQRDESAKRQLAQQQTETAKAEQMRIIAQGENDKATERVNKEKEQISQVIQYETERAIEEQKLKTAKIALETAEIEAKRIKEMADAKAYENSKLVAAGLTPQEKAEWEYKKAVGVAEQMKDVKLPNYVIMGGSNQSGKELNLIESLIGVKLMNLDGK
jgi:regulator of protease activity HflC (stomatin/prohibitin superfamily)